MRHLNVKRRAFAALLTVFALCSSYGLRAGDVDALRASGSNDLPDDSQTEIVYNRGNLPATAAVAGLPQTQAVATGSTVTVSNLGISVSGFVLIGWHTNLMPVVSNLTIATVVKTAPTFYEIGASFTVSGPMNLYAVWALDANNNGIVDYAEMATWPTSSNVSVRSGAPAQEAGISLRSGEVPAWNTNFDQVMFDDSVYYTGCTYNDGTDVNGVNNGMQENLIRLDGGYCFNALITKFATPMNFIIEYGGVLTDRSMTGGAAQQPLSTIEVTPAMIARGFTVDSLINYHPFRFTEIREDGQAILKMYFIDPLTGNHPSVPGRDWVDISSYTISWPKPFKDPETGNFTDTLVLKFNIYNKPEFESEIISQHLDARGNIRLNHLSGTPLKYMMRSIDGHSWQPASAPLSDRERLAVNDSIFICLRELDRGIAYQNTLREFYLSDRFNKNQVGFGSVYYWELYHKYLFEYNAPIWIDFEASTYFDPVVQSIYDAFLSINPDDPDFALGYARYLCLFTYYPLYNPADAEAYATLKADEYWPTFQQEMAASIPFPDPCREVTWLTFETIVIPDVWHYVEINTIPGVTATPAAGIRHYVTGHGDFTFTLTFPDGKPLKVMTTGYYSHHSEETDWTEDLGGGTFRYVIRRMTDHYAVTVLSEPASRIADGNEMITGSRLWTYSNTLYIHSDKAARARIYTLSGTLFKQLSVPEGTTGVQLERGIYIVEMDGLRYKAVVR